MFPGCDERVAASALNPNRSDLTMIERISNVVSAMMLTACVTGCAQRGHFTAATLPAELQAPPVENSQTIDLSCLAGPAASRDLIGPGDLLKVSLAAGLDAGAVVNIFARVGDDGIALLPEVGPIHLAGLYLVQAEQQIAAACVGRGLYRQPHVTVAMEQQRTNRVTVVGAVKEPGIHELPRGSSYLLAGIMAAGGLAEDAGTHIEIRHPALDGRLAWQGAPSATAPGVQLTGNMTVGSDASARVVRLDLTEAVHQGVGGEYLHDGSVVTIERKQPQPIQVIGLVRKPGQYEFPIHHDLRLFDAIALANGTSSRLADQVVVIRGSPDEQNFVRIAASLSSAKRNPAENLRLAPGDIVSVEETVATAVAGILESTIRFGMTTAVPLF